MSRQSKIKWSDADRKELERVVKNFNAKISRLAKKNPDMAAALPPKMSLAKRSAEQIAEQRATGAAADRIYITELINTRADLKRELNALKRFSKKGAEQLKSIPGNENEIQITKWQYQEMTRRAAVINRRRARRLEQMENIEALQRGEKLGYKRGDIGMGRADRLALEPIKPFTRTQGRRELGYKLETLYRESRSDYFKERDQLLRDNYIKAIENNYNPDDPRIQKVIKKIKGMDLGTFVNNYMAEDPDMEFIYPLNKEEQDRFISELETIWKV